MASSQRPTRKTVSRCEPETEKCTHVFEIADYILQKDVAPGEFIQSAIFSVGGHNWRIRFFPNGEWWEDSEEFEEDYVSLYLVFLSTSNNNKARALYDFRLHDAATGASTSVCGYDTVFSSGCTTWGSGNLMEKSELEEYYLREDDCLVIECDVTVITGTAASQSKAMCDIQVPPSVLSDNLGNLMESQKGTDVAFEVKGQVFHAHKIVLAMRSPVFMAELYGPMSDSKMKTITVEDMQPAVFKALLHFIYKDSMPSMEGLDGHDNVEMAKHLLVAADRYGMERMKVMCECILGRRLDVDNVADTLALADQHHCSQLKDTCIGFINSSNRMGDVIASLGYAHLKRACPAVIVEILEKSAKTRKI